MEQLENELIEIEAQLAAKSFQSSAIALGGGLAGYVYASSKEKSFWSKVGYYFLASLMVGTAVNVLTASKRAKLLARKLQIEKQLGR